MSDQCSVGAFNIHNCYKPQLLIGQSMDQCLVIRWWRESHLPTDSSVLTCICQLTSTHWRHSSEMERTFVCSARTSPHTVRTGRRNFPFCCIRNSCCS